jgi:hypothetical protein
MLHSRQNSQFSLGFELWQRSAATFVVLSTLPDPYYLQNRGIQSSAPGQLSGMSV